MEEFENPPTDGVCAGCWDPLYTEEALTSPPSPFYFDESCYLKYGQTSLFCEPCEDLGRARPATYYAAQKPYRLGEVMVWVKVCDGCIEGWTDDAEPDDPAPVFKLVPAEAPRIA